MVELLKKLRDNDVEMVILNNPDGPDDIMVNFYKRCPDYSIGAQGYSVKFSIEELEKSTVGFEYLVSTYLDVFLYELKKRLEYELG